MAFIDKCCNIGYIYGYKIETQPHGHDHVKIVIEEVNRNQSVVLDIVFPWDELIGDVLKIIKSRFNDDDWDLVKYYIEAIWKEQKDIMISYYHEVKS